ncbi:hypothetical protein [Nonomuraea roseoviolacea]|uniref:Uncharacterized protein n=1 Tax=Nonomuraea roseoviolacea subsp. carminata TaxID=160689 RepID=A0ABT1K9D6_9ACTN|nr:hypothetical protein [Nonomuraea roseoviolacea]MCP2350639.1 hypothetical protein [Nonomuraea roseoviolacea subsp. carminata]
MIRWLLRRFLPELVRCERCGMIIGYNTRALGEKPVEQYRVEHDRICLLAEPGTPPPERRPGDEVRDEFTPEEYAEFQQLVAVKQAALIQEMTLHLNRSPDNEEEMIALLATIQPQLVHPIMGMGPAAMNRATLDIVTHLVTRLAQERGEPIAVTWQREAAELAREDGPM